MRWILALGLLIFQVQQPPAASIDGIVVRAGTSQPIARARVIITKMDGGPVGRRALVTDGTGRFAFRDIPPGRYQIVATREGYVRAEYGQRNTSRAGTPAVVSAGQELKDVTLALIPTSAIAGRVYDRYGEPVVNANVVAYRSSYVEGRRTLITVESARTNDLGEYRLYWMQPGQYVVSVAAAQNAALEGVVGVPDTARLTVYYPGTTDWTAASAIDLRPGVNYTGVDLTVVETRAVHVRGRVVSGDSNSGVSDVSVQLISRRGAPGGGPPQMNAALDAEGRFDFVGVAPGSYDVVAMVTQRISANPAVLPRVVGGLTARVPIEVGSADLDNVQLTLHPPIKVPGRLTVEGFTSGQNLPGKILVELRHDPPLILRGSEVAVVNSTDGSFVASAPITGNYRIVATGLPRNAYIKSARLGGSEALNAGLQIDGEPQGELDIVIGLSPGTFSAVVLDEKQQPQRDVMVVLVPDPARRRRFDIYENALTNDSGRVLFEGVLPGDYRAFAWEEVESFAWQDPDFIRKYEDRGVPVRISEGGTITAELKILHQ